jgi:hypothetical protein
MLPSCPFLRAPDHAVGRQRRCQDAAGGGAPPATGTAGVQLRRSNGLCRSPAQAEGRRGVHAGVIRVRLHVPVSAGVLSAWINPTVRPRTARMQDKPSPIRPTDAEARALARRLIDGARFAALAFLDPDSRLPAVSRVAVATDDRGQPVTLISTLARHTLALQAEPRAALLLGEPGGRGDPLTHPRLSLDVTAGFVMRGSADHEALRACWLRVQPKARLYIDFSDFGFVRFAPRGAALNGGFGKAYVLTPADLAAG